MERYGHFEDGWRILILRVKGCIPALKENQGKNAVHAPNAMKWHQRYIFVAHSEDTNTGYWPYIIGGYSVQEKEDFNIL